MYASFKTSVLRDTLMKFEVSHGSVIEFVKCIEYICNLKFYSFNKQFRIHFVCEKLLTDEKLCNTES